MHITHRNRLAVRSITVVLFVMLALSLLSAAAFAAGGITLTKTDTLIDLDGDGLADPGETIRYTLTIANTNGFPVANLQLLDVLDANTTLVNGTLNVSPLAVNDAYETVGNTLLEVGVAAGSAPAVRTTGSVLANDREFLGDSYAIVSFDSTSANGGTVNLNADGTFTYLPVAGFSGADTFTYTLADSGSLTGTGAVTVNVLSPVWYVDDSAAAGGTGRSTAPFQTLAQAQNASTAGNVIYLFSGNYNAGLTLKNNQVLTGEGVALSVGGFALRAAGTRPEISANTTLITLASGNTVQGLNLTTSAGSALTATSANVSAIEQVNITLSGSATGLHLSGQAGTFTYTNGSIQGTTTGRGIQVDGGAAAFSFQSVTVNISNGGGLSFANKTGGNVIFDAGSPVTVNGSSSAAVFLDRNLLSSFTFNAAMNLTTTSGNALDVYNSGTLTVLGSSNTISTTTGTGVKIQGTNIGTSGVTFRSVSTNGGANGILLANTGSLGAFQVTGSGTTDGSGGTIQNTTLSGVYLSNAQQVYLNNLTLTNANLSGGWPCTYNDNNGCNAAVKMSTVTDVRLVNVDISGTAQTGVNGTGVAGFTYNNSVLSVTTDQLDEDGIDLRQATGAITITNNQMNNAYDRGILVRNTSGSANLTITGNTFQTTTLNDAVSVELGPGGNASADVTFANNAVTNANGAGFRLNNEGSGMAQTWVNNNTISGSGVGVDLSAAGSGLLNFDVSDNPQIHAAWAAINIVNYGPTANMQGRVENNPSIRASDSESSALWVHAADGGQIIALVNNNAIENYGYRGIEVEALRGASRADVTLTANTVSHPSAGTPDAGVYLRSGSTTTGDSSILCVNANANSLTVNQPYTDMQLRWFTQTTTRFYVQGLTNFVVANPIANPVGDYLKTVNLSFSDYSVSTGTYAAATCLTTSFTAEPPTGPALAQSNPPSGTAAASIGKAVAAAPAESDPAATTIHSARPGLSSLLPAWLLRPSGAGETISENLGTLPAGKTLTVRFDVTVNESISGGVKAISNQAQVTADGIPATLSNDPDTAAVDDPTRTAHGAAPELSVAKQNNPAQATAGNVLTYTIGYANNGTQHALGVQITDTLPAGTTYNAAGSTAGWSCAAGVCTFSIASLPAGSSGTLTLAVTVDNQFAAGVNSLSNQVTIADDGSGGSDPNTANNSATLVTPLVAQPELSLTKSDQNVSFMPGETIVYTLSYGNSGSQAATGVELRETVPANTSYDAANSSAGWVCAVDGGPGDTCVLSLGNLAAGANGVRTFAVTVADPADGVVQISNTARIRDDGANGAELDPDNNQSTDTTPIRNRPPALSGVAITSSVNENGVATLSGSLSDPESGPLTLLVAWGDGQSGTFSYAAGTTSFSETHVYLDDNPSGTPSDAYTVGLTLRDASGGEDTAQVTTTVVNTAPALSQLSASPVLENGVATLTGSISDAGTLDTFTLLVDWGDGTDDTYTYPAGTTSFSETHVYVDNPASPAIAYTIQLELTDDDTGSDSASQPITVSNAAPVFGTISVADADEGSPTVLSGLFSDPGAQDTFTLVVDWGDGTPNSVVNLPAGSNRFDLPHTYADDNPTGTPANDYTITLTITDNDGGSDVETRSLTVSNVAPQIENLSAAGAFEGTPVSLSGNIVDPGSGDSFTLAVNWGDGTAVENFPLAVGSTSFNVTHTYVDDNPSGTPADDYTVAVTLLDDDGGSDSSATTATVTNAAPVVNAGGDFSVYVGEAFTLSGSFTDSGSTDTHTYSWDMGNGDMLSGSLTPSYTYTSQGVMTATLTVTDDDGGVGSDTVQITVAPYADLALEKIATPASVLLGTQATFELTVTNLGPSGASDVLLVDELPAGLALVSAPAACTSVGQTVSCDLGNLANGASASVNIVADVTLTSPGSVLNTASVSALEDDPDAANNAASAMLQAGTVVTVIDSDFEDEVPPEWQGCANDLSQTPRGERGFLGEFGNQTVCLSLSDLPQHNRVLVTFDLFILRSWDGNVISTTSVMDAAAYPEYWTSGIIGPDRWQLHADGIQLIDTTFSNWMLPGVTQAYPGSYPTGFYPPRHGASESSSLGYNFRTVTNQDAVYRISRVIEHKDANLLLEFTGLGLQNIDDESWGLDNVKIVLMDTTEWYQMYLPVIHQQYTPQ